MYSSNGDSYLDIEEVTYYLAFLISSGFSSTRTYERIEKVCNSVGSDPFGKKFFDIGCFRRNYFVDTPNYWDHFAEMDRFYTAQDSATRQEMQVAIEQASRKFGYSDKPIGMYDIDGIAGLVHYMEAMFSRFDRDGNQELVLDELLKAPTGEDSAIQVFKGTIAQLGGLDPDSAMTEAAFTYTVRFGHPPDQSFPAVLDFLAWYAWKPFWSIHATRGSLYNVISVLSTQ
jgi:hypothetical protein